MNWLIYTIFIFLSQRTASERDQPTEAPSTPVESLVKKLTAERIIELKKAIYEEQQQYAKLKEEILFLQSTSMDEKRIKEMWNQIEQEKIQKEREQVQHDQWLKEREEKKLQHERQWRGPYKAANIRPQKSQDESTMEPDTTTATTQQQSGTSPLLTSLLKSPSQPTVQQPSLSNNSARVAPTITNLLTTGTSSAASNTPNIISQKNPSFSSSTSVHPNININASASAIFVPNIIKTDNSASSSHSIVSQSAPTLITLLDKKTSISSQHSESSTAEKQQMIMSIESGGKDGDIVKDDEAELLADFNELIDAEKFDIDEDLEDLNSIIMNPEILDEKISDGEPTKDADESSQATSTDDYDKLKIKQIVETIQDLAGVSDVDTSHGPNVVSTTDSQEPATLGHNHENEVVPLEPESSSGPTTIDIIEPQPESNDSCSRQKNIESKEEKIVLISDESSNANDEKKELICERKIEINDGEESQSVKSSEDIKDDPSGDDSNKGPHTFQGISINESDENSFSSEKEPKETTSFQIEDSEDAIFEDAKETHSETGKQSSTIKESLTEKSLQEAPETPKAGSKSNMVTEVEEASRSAIDSDEEVLEVKVSRSTSRRRGNDSLKADTPSSSTRSRDHSENDDNRDTTPIRTRSRHSSTAISEHKSSFNFSKEQDHSMWKSRWEDCVRELQKLREFSQIIDNKVVQDEMYKKVCLHPMNMKIIAKNIELNISTLPGDIKRDFVLMCTNIIMLNNKGQKYNEIVNQFTKDAVEIIDSHMDVEDVYKSYRRQIKKKS